MNIVLGVILLLTVRRLVWCIRWLWCYHRGRPVPPPIGWLPRQSGRVFDGHLANAEERKNGGQ